MTGRVTVVGLGPGRSDWCAPAVDERMATATDLVGYGPYLDLVPASVPGRRHRSGNRVEGDRAGLALDLAEEGGDVVVVSSGDPGVFGMASAVLEQLDRHPDRWQGVEVEVLPGISAAQAVASRVGAPLGHDFCVISLSDVLKPWSVIERRLEAAAAADFVIALYNPRSRHRPHQLADALAIVGRHRSPDDAGRRRATRRAARRAGRGGRAGPARPGHGRHEHGPGRRFVVDEGARSTSGRRRSTRRGRRAGSRRTS